MRPAKFLKIIAAGLLVTKLFHQFAEVNGFCHKAPNGEKEVEEAQWMTDEEALKHLFHPKIVRAVKKHLKEQEGGTGKPRLRK
jgi:hypothetical protein